MKETYWSRLFLMVILAVGIFAILEYVPTILSGVFGTSISFVAASVFLYCFGHVTGRMLAEPSSQTGS